MVQLGFEVTDDCDLKHLCGMKFPVYDSEVMSSNLNSVKLEVKLWSAVALRV